MPVRTARGARVRAAERDQQCPDDGENHQAEGLQDDLELSVQLSGALGIRRAQLSQVRIELGLELPDGLVLLRNLALVPGLGETRPPQLQAPRPMPTASPSPRSQLFCWRLLKLIIMIDDRLPRRSPFLGLLSSHGPTLAQRGPQRERREGEDHCQQYGRDHRQQHVPDPQ